MKRKDLDIERIKIFPSGKLSLNPLYKHSIEVQHQCKLYAASNHTPKFKASDSQGIDSGLERRGLFIETKQRFLPPDEFEQASEKKMSNIHQADLTLIDKFNSTQYQLAFIHLLLPYAKQAFTSLHLPQLRATFKQACLECDRFQMMINEYYEITGVDSDKVTRDKLKE